MKLTKMILSGLVLLLFSCNNNMSSISGTGNIVSSDIALTPFQDVELQSNCNVELISGPQYQATISDYANLTKYIKLEVIGSKLIIRIEPETAFITNSKAKAIVSIPAATLNSLSISGSGNIDLKSPFNNIRNVNIAGSGSINSEVASSTNNLSVSIAGSGSANLSSIQSQSSNCDIAGSGNINVAVSNSLNAVIAGSGNVIYQGNPTITKNISGSGNVVKL